MVRVLPRRTASPFEDVVITKKRTTKDPIRFFHPLDEYPLLIKHAPNDEAREAYGIAAGTGARPSELRNFDWADVNLRDGLITFRYGGSEDGATKSGKVKTVPLLPEGRKWLEARVQRLHGGVKPANGLIFVSPKTGRAFERNYTFGVNEAISAAGIEKRDRLFYAFRHTFCVALANGFYGEDVQSRHIARELMRQDDEDVIDQYYKILGATLRAKVETAKALTTDVDPGDNGDDVSENPEFSGDSGPLGKVALYH